MSADSGSMQGGAGCPADAEVIVIAFMVIWFIFVIINILIYFLK